MKEVKYEPRAQSKMHLYKFKQVSKVQLVGDILIFLKPVWHNYIFEYLLHMPAKWGKVENREKHTKIIILTSHTDFAPVSTDFVRWGCNFT